MSTLQLSLRRLAMVAWGVVLAATLAACGRHGESQPSFIDIVTAVVNNTADNTEPMDINFVTVETTETEEPVPVS